MSFAKRDKIKVTTVEDLMSVEDRPAPAYDIARKAMIDSQLRTSGVNADFVLQRMNAVAREQFVPAEARGHAYIDRAVPLGDGRFLAAPVVHGMMLQEAEPTAQDTALLVDGGSGYLAELLRPLVSSLDVVSAADAATATGGTYTLLLVDGATDQLPAALVARLADNGRVVTGLLDQGITRLATGRKIAGQVALAPLADIGMPVLPELLAPKGWSF